MGLFTTLDSLIRYLIGVRGRTGLMNVSTTNPVFSKGRRAPRLPRLPGMLSTFQRLFPHAVDCGSRRVMLAQLIDHWAVYVSPTCAALCVCSTGDRT